MTDDAQTRRDELAATILDMCGRRGVYVAAAESLTGGLLADAFVRIPGASRVFLGSAVTYDIAAKAAVLGVDAGLLAAGGAVQAPVAAQMAAGTARLYGVPGKAGRVIGLSTTGVAGPGPDGDKPAGLVYVGIALPGASGPETSTYELHLGGSREDVRLGTVLHVLRHLSEAMPRIRL
ncbi:damage-inducible protein CinA [Bifidobacterium sp. DSM 109958]|uniref:Damage-inducible protein CinA n=1 Tax=Bifidobacterium moraviense TaxID=2675323 RepID=A0A7Y0HZG8_9BIFI|nr:nicotinamide-nucleotide amidohydrolase family protein [Bifidobacterium sp. DSM 109958]NMN00383.1 damage-inducible protein CinA [Bifidobacterium sp. DSM 109958]